jgi:hypothetical protein
MISPEGGKMDVAHSGAIGGRLGAHLHRVSVVAGEVLSCAGGPARRSTCRGNE